MEEIRARAAEKKPLALVPVDLGDDKPKLNLTLLEGNDVKDTGLLPSLPPLSPCSAPLSPCISSPLTPLDPDPLSLLLPTVLCCSAGILSSTHGNQSTNMRAQCSTAIVNHDHNFATCTEVSHHSI
jgi:hypothetical protein